MEILCFHRVVADRHPRDEPYFVRGTALSLARFIELLDERRDRRFVDEREATRLLFSPPADHDDACWITFDDGYADVLAVAAPELARRGIRPTLFMSGAALRPGWSYPVNRWYAALTGATRTVTTLDGLGAPPRRVDLSWAEDRASLIAGPEKDAFIRRSAADQRSRVEQLGRAFNSIEIAPPPLLDRSNLEELVRLGWTIGAHGRTHVLLSETSEAVIAEEVGGSVADLGFLGAARSAWFAWPDGRSDDRARDWLRHAAGLGLRGALALDGGVGDARLDPARVRRVLAR